MASIITRDDLKTYLGISGTREDSKLDLLINGVESAVKRYTGREFASQSYTGELYDGTGTPYLYLRQRPVTAVSDLRVAQSAFGGAGHADAFESDTQWTKDEDFILHRDDESEHNRGLLIVVRSKWPTTPQGIWPEGVSNIQVDYTAGYASIPEDLKLAIYQLAARMRASAKKGAMLSGEKFGSYSYTVLKTDKSAEVVDARSILNDYAQVAI